MSRLDPTNISAFKFNENIAGPVENVCQPLSNYLGITHAGYIKIFNDGTMLRMANKPEWTKKYFEQSFYNDVDLYGMKDVPENGMRISFLTGNPTSDHYRALCSDFNIWNFLIISKKFANHSEFWFFGTTRDNTEILNYYLNHINVFKEFTLYFRNYFSEIIDHHNPSQLIVSKLKSIDYNDEQDDKVVRLLQEIKIKAYHLKDDIYLSQREKDCLHYLASGRTMKEIARLINLSPRTVEYYINTLKLKTNSHTKSNLIKLFYESPNYL